MTPEPSLSDRSLFDRIGGREGLVNLLRHFYADVRQHRVIGPVFAAHITDWPQHVELIADFWSMATGGPVRYSRNMPGKHVPLGLSEEHFQAWLDLWGRHCSAWLAAPEAQEMIARAEGIAVQLRRLLGVSPGPAAPRTASIPRPLCLALLGLLAAAPLLRAQAPSGRPRFPWEMTPQERHHLDVLNAADEANMLAQLGITKLRPGPSGMPGMPNPANTDPVKANPYPDYPDPLVMADGRPVTTPEMWWRERRPQIVALFEENVLGKVPSHVPQVAWSAARTVSAQVGGIPIVGREVIGQVDNSGCPQITVNLRMVVVVPAQARGPVPVLMMFGFGSMPGTPEPWFGPPGSEPPDPPSTVQLIRDGWGYVSIDTTSIQADSGAGLTSGIIGLTNHGRHRKPDDWGALRAWAWGASRGLDYLETDAQVDAHRAGIEGVSRYGKAALVTMAFDPRFATALIGSSGEAGAKPYRRNFGEEVENIASSGEYHWMAGNFLRYAAAESKFGSLNAGDMPVDSPELIALCAPRLTFISYGIPAKGDAKWLDQQGSYMATVDASRVFRLLGARGIGAGQDYHTARMPPVNTGLLAGQLAWRQHDQGHQDRSNMKYFLAWADRMMGRPGIANSSLHASQNR